MENLVSGLKAEDAVILMRDMSEEIYYNYHKDKLHGKSKEQLRAEYPEIIKTDTVRVGYEIKISIDKELCINEVAHLFKGLPEDINVCMVDWRIYPNDELNPLESTKLIKPGEYLVSLGVATIDTIKFASLALLVTKDDGQKTTYRVILDGIDGDSKCSPSAKNWTYPKYLEPHDENNILVNEVLLKVFEYLEQFSIEDDED